ncbi:ATP--guanido phosphotransferase [bacterium]|nr:ATP--guanido phosphotransferase [bacterium]
MKRINFLAWDIIEKKTRWIFEKFSFDNVITSRVRIARNLKKYPFPNNMSYSEAKEVENILLKVLVRYPSDEIFVIKMDEINNVEKQLLIERHIISKEFVESPIPSSVVILPTEGISIMINEEDHMRIQCLQSGFNLKKALRKIEKVDNFLDERVEFAFSPDIGYLTACPTNVGTALRASVLIHLPALAILNKTEKIFSAIEDIDIMVRGFYGEGSHPSGNIFQITTRETAGKSEREIIEELEAVISVILEYEEEGVKEIMKKEDIKRKIEKKIKKIREYNSITTEEFLYSFSFLCLGKKLEIINVGERTLRNLIMSILPGHLQFNEKKEISPLTRDIERGKIIRKKLRRILNNV